MADILATWLNEEVGLSKKVTSFEQDFANGYLFGELLYKFNQQNDFELFSSKDVISHRVKNFEKLEPTFRNLHVKFDSNLVDKIMKGERGCALRLLYQLKMILEKVYPPTDIIVLTKTGQFGDNQPAQKIAKPMEKFDKIQHEHFKARLAALNKPQKQINMEAHVEKFIQEKQRQTKLAKDGDDSEKKAELQRKQDLRRIQINKLQRNAGFMEEWQQKGVDDWKKNQKLKKEREMEELEFDFKQAQKYNAAAIKKLENAHVEVYDGILKFEQTLRDQGINPSVEKEKALEAVTQSFKNTTNDVSMKTTVNVKGMRAQGMTTATGAFTLSSTGLKQRTKKTLTDANRLAREKRRRRLIGQQEELMQELEQKQRENMVVELMKHQAAQEKELEYEVWRTQQCKNVIIQNRNLRENQYIKRKQLDKKIAESKEIQLLAVHQHQTHHIIEEKIFRDGEMRQYEKDAQLKAHTILCSSLIDKIFDIADEAYKHQQKIDSKEIDPRNWHEWLQLFINEKDIAGTHDLLSALVIEENAGETSSKLETEEDSANALLDELEMIDYIKNQGQWNKELVSKNKPNLEQIINPPAEAVVTGKKGAPVKGQAAQEVQFEPDDLEIKDLPDNNFLLGDAIEQIIKLNYEDRARLKHPQTPNWLPLKISLVGYPFSGKKLQAQKVKEKFGLNVYIMDELIQEAIQYSKDHQEPIDRTVMQSMSRHSQLSSLSGAQTDYENLSEDEEGFINSPEDFRLCGKQIQDLLLSGEEISDELYVKLFVTKLRLSYEYKDPQTQRKEIQIAAKRQVELQRRLLQIDEELDQEGLSKKKIKALETEKISINQQLENMNDVKPQGWILVDFPCSYSQAKLLEKALSGYEPEEELELIERQKQLNDAILLVQPNPKEEPLKTLIQSGLDAVIWFNCSINECLRRADGRRIDVEDESDKPEMFHVEDKKPPTDIAPLCERLDHVKDDSNCTGSLIDRYVSFDQTTRSMQSWLIKFGVEEKQRNLLCIINAEQPEENVHQQVQAVLQTTLNYKEDKINNARDILAFKIKQIQEERLRLVKEEEEKNALKSQEDFNRQGAGTPSHRSDNGTTRNPDVSPHRSRIDKSVIDATNSVLSQAQAVPERERIDNDFKPVIIQLWKELSINYKCQMQKIFKNFRLHREQILTRRSDIQKKFLDYLHNADGKQAILDEFVQNFNQFSDEYPDLREDDQTKEELHQRTDVLSDELWEIVEERKEHSIEFRKQIMESGTLESSLVYTTSIAQQLMQAELDKFKINIQIIQDYYHAIEEKLIPEAPQTVTVELGFDDGDAPSVETLPEGADPYNPDSYSYPRLDKLLLLALKNQVISDVSQANQAADPKNKNAPKGKAPPQKGSIQTSEEGKMEEESLFVKELKEAIKVEKGILRYRLVQIRNWTLKNLKDSRKDFIQMYKKLEDWIFVAQKAEMEAIDQMCIVIKNHIESEQKIKSELRIDFMDFTVDKSTLNFITPPPPLLEAREDYREDRFSIDQLNFFKLEFEQMEASCITRENFPRKSVTELFLSKRNASIGFGGYLTALPADWNKFTAGQIRQMTFNLDLYCSGFITWKTMITYFIILKSPMPSEKDIQSIKKTCKNTNGYVSFEDFINFTFWFDKTETSVDRPNSLHFNRVEILKKMLFSTHSKIIPGFSDPMVDLNNLCEVFITPQKQNPKLTFKDYLDFMFYSIDPVPL